MVIHNSSLARGRILGVGNWSFNGPWVFGNWTFIACLGIGHSQFVIDSTFGLRDSSLAPKPQPRRRANMDQLSTSRDRQGAGYRDLKRKTPLPSGRGSGHAGCATSCMASGKIPVQPAGKKSHTLFRRFALPESGLWCIMARGNRLLQCSIHRPV